MDSKRDKSLWDDVREWVTDATRTAIREAEAFGFDSVALSEVM